MLELGLIGMEGRQSRDDVKLELETLFSQERGDRIAHTLDYVVHYKLAGHQVEPASMRVRSRTSLKA